MTPAVETLDAYRIYESAAGGTVALQGLTLTVEPGEIVVVLGPSGSGKSTLLRVLAGFERLSAGTARVLGVEVGRLSARQVSVFRARQLGLLDQHYARSLSPELSCLQSIGLQLRLQGARPEDAAREAMATLERVGLSERASDRPQLLSGGEQQRVAVCAAVAHRPRLLLADEPAGELDADNATRIYSMLAELVREAEGTAVIVSHDTAAAEIADRLVYIRDGRVVEEERPGEARSLVASHGWVRIPEAVFRKAGRPKRLTVTHEEGQIALEPVGEIEADEEQIDDRVPPADSSPRVVSALEHVTKRFGGAAGVPAAVEGLSHSFRAGTFTVVVGRSGSGKTTLLHLLAGLERATSGAVTLLGVDLASLDRAQLALLRRDHVALVSQEPGLIPYLTALENVQLALAVRGREDCDGSLAEGALAEVGLRHRLSLKASRLSAGERQRVAVARAIAAHAELLLIDEPTARLDEENAKAVGRLLGRAAHRHGLAVVCATHDPVLIEAADEIVPLAGRIGRLDALPAV
jgi:ABC-type lipoprotein export system ATPase subunit